MQEINEDLTCPITNDWLDDPVSLPCCGRGISRQQLINK